MLQLKLVPIAGMNVRPPSARQFAPATAPTMGQLNFVGAGTTAMLVSAGISGGIGYAGYYLATHQKPVGWKVLGYGVAILGGLSALGGVLGALFWNTYSPVVQSPVVIGR